MRIILLGPAGSGKGTQADLIMETFGFPKISTGDLLRQAVHQGTELGKKVSEVMKAGNLVEDEIVLKLVEERIQLPDCRQGYVLDGFPRNLNQALLLEKMVKDSQEIVFEIEATEEEILKRLAGRRVCLQCQAVYNINNDNNKTDNSYRCNNCGSKLVIREDDKPEVIRERYKIYIRNIKPLIDYYAGKGVLFQIDGQKPVEEVFRAIKSIIEKKLSNYSVSSGRR